MFEQVFLWVLTVLVVPVYYILQFLSDLCYALGKFFDSMAEGSLRVATEFADFVLRRD